MRAAIELEAILALLRDAHVSELAIDRVRALYKSTYTEAYADGKSDCEDAQMDQENEDA